MRGGVKFEIAEQRAQQQEAYARAQGYPKQPRLHLGFSPPSVDRPLEFIVKLKAC